MDDWIDVSPPISPRLPVWPGSPGVEMTRRLDLGRGDPVNDTTIRFSVHTGSHVDAPLHFLAGAAAADALPLTTLIGPAHVAAVPDADAITADVLRGLDLPQTCERLLLRTRNSERWAAAAAFDPGYVALTEDAAHWVVERDIRLIGLDAHSIQRYADGPQTHLILLAAGIVIVEGLDLSGVAPGPYELVCLPLRLVGAEGAPARVVLRGLVPSHE